jgi:hypothetical protein
MAHIPKDARWYLAELVLEHTVEGDSRNVVHVNIHLIEAESPERAYEKANALGCQSEQVYANMTGKDVRVAFRGLRDLNVIHDKLEDGAELTYEESTNVPEAELAGLVRAKTRLGLFRERQSSIERDVPNYMSESVMKSLEEAGFDRDDIEGGA